MSQKPVINHFREAAQTVKRLKKLVGREEVLHAEIEVSGYILLNSGIDRIAENLSLPVETEHFESEDMTCDFKVLRLSDGAFEVLQIVDTEED